MHLHQMAVLGETLHPGETPDRAWGLRIWPSDQHHGLASWVASPGGKDTKYCYIQGSESPGSPSLPRQNGFLSAEHSHEKSTF